MFTSSNGCLIGSFVKNANVSNAYTMLYAISNSRHVLLPAAPVIPTSDPVAPTVACVTSTSAPVAPTAAPASPTPAPVTPTARPTNGPRLKVRFEFPAPHVASLASVVPSTKPIVATV